MEGDERVYLNCECSLEFWVYSVNAVYMARNSYEQVHTYVVPFEP